MAMITDVEDYFTKGCGRCDRFGTPDCSTRRWIDVRTARGVVRNVRRAAPDCASAVANASSGVAASTSISANT